MREQRVIRGGKRLLEATLRHGYICCKHLLAQRPDRDPTRNVTGRMTAHSIGDRKYPVLRRVQQCIFIAPPAQPEVAATAARQLHDCSGGSTGRHMDCHVSEPEMRTRSLFVLVPALIAAPACGRSADEAIAQQAPPPAAVLAPLSADHGVEQALEMLAAELDATLQSELGDGGASLFRAEAITDRLLETRRPFAWIPDVRYLVDSRLRQVQAEADRIVAQFQSGAPRDTVLAAVRGMATEVARLREELARPGAAAPPSLERLLARDTAGQGAAEQSSRQSPQE